MPESAVTLEAAVPFARAGSRDLLCDLYFPAGARNGAAVILLYGGGWRVGDPSRMRPAAELLAARGFVCVAPEYRLTGEAPWPANIHDVKAAIRWTRANAGRLAIDAARIALQGHSAGGQLALLAAATPGSPALEGDGGNADTGSEVAAVAAFYAPVLFFASGKRPSGGSPASALLGEGAGDQDARLASPITHVSERFPPTFLLHGTADDVVPPSASMRFYEALTALSVPCELKMYAGLRHGFDNDARLLELAEAEVAQFFVRYLLGGRPVSPAAATRSTS